MPSAPVYFAHLRIEEGGVVRHDVKESFEMGRDVFPDNAGGWKIEKASPLHCGGSEKEVIGAGGSISVAITDWFHSLCNSLIYEPIYKKKKC